MTTIDVRTLFTKATAAQIYQAGLEIAQALGLAVSTWRTGDPTRVQFKHLATILEARDSGDAEFIRAGFLSAAVQSAKDSGDASWLKVLSLEVYGVEAPEATYATPTATVTNSGGGFYPIAANDLTFKSTESNKTYHNTNAHDLVAGETFAFTLEADEPGSDSSAGVDEIDELVTSLPGVVVVSSTAAVASDEATPDEISVLCLATLGALSPNGPADAYESVALNSELTGVTEINRAHTVDNSATGNVTLVVASASGTVSGPSVTAVQDAIELWATPNCITPTTISATPVVQAVTYTVTGDSIPAGFNENVEGALGLLFAAIQIGGTVARSAIIATIHSTLVALGASNVVVSLSVPSVDDDLADTEVAVLGVVTGTEI